MFSGQQRVVLFDRQHQFKHLVKMNAVVVVILLAVASFFFSVCIEFMHANAAKIKLWLEENNIQIAHLALTFLESSFKEKVIKLKFTIFFVSCLSSKRWITWMGHQLQVFRSASHAQTATTRKLFKSFSIWSPPSSVRPSSTDGIMRNVCQDCIWNSNHPRGSLDVCKGFLRAFFSQFFDT